MGAMLHGCAGLSSAEHAWETLTGFIADGIERQDQVLLTGHLHPTVSSSWTGTAERSCIAAGPRALVTLAALPFVDHLLTLQGLEGDEGGPPDP